MPTRKNKVRFNLKNVHYATLSFEASGTPSFGTPIPVPGAVSLKITPKGEAEKFYADGGVYYIVNNNAGYEGELELAIIPQDLCAYGLGETTDSNGVLVERSDAEFKPFALLFEFDGDVRRIRHVLYNCVASRPSTEGKTIEEKKEVQTETLSLTASSMPDGVVRARTGDETTDAIYNGWYESVYLPDTTNDGTTNDGN